MKKLLLTIFSVFMLTSVAYATDVSIEISDACGAVGETVYVAVSISENEAETGGINIKYNPEMLRPVSASTTIGGTYCNLEYGNDVIRFNWSQMASGELYTFGFEVLSDKTEITNLYVEKYELYKVVDIYNYISYKATSNTASVYLNGFYPDVKFMKDGAEVKALSDGLLDVDFKLINGLGESKDIELFFAGYDKSGVLKTVINEVYITQSGGQVEGSVRINIPSDIEKVRVYCWDYTDKGMPYSESFDISR